MTVRALDQFGNVALGEQRTVSIAATGSATSTGIIFLSNGIGSRSIRNSVPETVIISLLDTQSLGVIVSSTNSVTFASGLIVYEDLLLFLIYFCL